MSALSSAKRSSLESCDAIRRLLWPLVFSRDEDFEVSLEFDISRAALRDAERL